MSIMLATLSLTATFPERMAPKAPVAAEAMKDCCAKMKADGKDCCCCKDKGAAHSGHAKTAREPGPASAEQAHDH